MTFMITTLLVVLLLYFTSPCNGRGQLQLEQVKIVMLLEGQFSSNENNTEYQCYISNSDGSTSVESFRKINTREPRDTPVVSGSNNPAPPDAVPVDGSKAQWRVDLDEERNNDFGVFGCRATQAGKRETEILGVFMRSDAEIIPKDELFTKTVSVGETGVSIDVEVIRPPPQRDDGIVLFIRWLKSNSRNDALNRMNSWPITRPVTVDDAGVYECHYDRWRNTAFQGLQLLIVRACASGRWGPPDCFGICDNCYNGGICDDKTGRCICAPGFMGPNCLTGCGSNRFGYQCEFTCATGNTENGCQGNQLCLVDPFGCRCNTGFQGLNCSDECEDGKFGAGCLQECHCQGSCNRFTGQCDSMVCEAPWSGQNCQIPDVCPDGYYGSDCTLKCLCRDNDACDRSTGQCDNGQCAPGSKLNGGLNCEACDEGFFGDSCSGECHCTPDACDIFTGECDGCCLPQWVDSSSCQDGISGFDVVKANPDAESMITCHWITRITTMATYQSQLSRSQEQRDEGGVSAMSPVTSSCTSNLCRRSRSFTISNAQPNDQFYCLLEQSSQIVAWLNTSSPIFVLPVLMEPPEVTFINQSSVTIRWKPWDQQSDVGDPPVVEYVTYYRETSETAVWMPADNVMHNEMLQFTYSGLFKDTNYEFSVAAAREGMNGVGSMSPSVTSRTLCNRPTAVPSSVLVEDLDMARLNISYKVDGSIFNCSTGITSFIIYSKLETSDDEPKMLVTSSDTWIIVSEDDGLQPGQRYIFFVSLVTDQESDLSQPSEPVTLQQEEATSRPPNGPPGGPSDDQPDGPPLAIIVALIAVVIVIFVVIIVVVAIKRRRKPQPVRPKDQPEAVYANNIMSTEDEQPTAGTVVAPVPPANVYMVSDFEQSPKRNSDLTHGKSETVDHTPPQVESNDDEDQDQVDEVEEIDVSNEPDGEIYMNVPRPMPVADLPAYYRANADKLSGEFQQLKRGPQFPWTFGEKNENKKKNRFRLMFTYDHSRVVLDTLPGDKHSDYYNASYIKDHKGKESFIASQAPNRASLNDFWRMIWKEEVYTIVMLTNLFELGKDRCTQYWPDREGTIKTYGNVVVSWTGTKHFADFDIRELKVTQMGEMRTIYQLHYSTWPDKNIPSDQAPLMELIKMTKLTHEGKVTPILTHCSAGVGRTGTFITIYCLMEVIKTEKDIHIFGFVEQARRDRINMVQTETQYGFIYKCLVDFCLTRHTEIPFKQLSNYNTNSKRNSLAKQFQLLNQFNVKRDSSTSRTVDRSRDRYQDSGPNEMGRVYLISEGSDGFSNYINATLYRSIRKTNAFIATQSPLPNTVEDFWRLVYDWKCSVIVMLNQLDPNDKTCVEYWPSSGHAQFGRIGVSCIDSSNYSTHILRKFEVFHSSGKSAFTVRQLQLLQWPESSNLSLWKELIQAVRLLQSQQQNMEPTLVHCINGIQLSGIFVAVEIALEYFKATGSLDVFNTIREMRQRNSNVIQHQEDYQLCFNILQFLLNPGNASYENLTFN